MTIIVEDGTIVASANSWVTALEADDYFTVEHPNATDWEGFDDDTKEASLRFAVKLLDTMDWYGYRADPSNQELSWPRNLVYDEDRQRYFQPNEIPAFLKDSQRELAVALAREDRTLVGESAAGAGLKRAKVDVLELEWFENSAKIVERAKPLIPSIVCRFIEPYTESGCGRGINVKLFRV
jgi:hypothetical protein